jgi:YHS domain-containing protein
MLILFRVVLLLLLALWLLRRFLGSFLGISKQGNAKGKFEDGPNRMVKDPVCGMYMDFRLAIPFENGKESLYFCSEECKNRYLGKSAKGKEAARTSPEMQE